MCRVRATLFALPFALLFAGCSDAVAVTENPAHEDARRYLSDYIRIDTSNPPGQETAGAKYLQKILAEAGVDAHLAGEDPERRSVWARLDSGSNEPALLLLHHIDVVPANPEEWKVPPFSGEVAGGYVWGRGALDAKSLGIAQLMAFLDLHRSGQALGRDVVLLAVADEETGGERGIRLLLESSPEIFEKVGYVLNEGGSNQTVVDRVIFWGVEVDQKVPLWLRLTARGPGGHAAAPPADGGASLKLVQALGTVHEQLSLGTELVPSVETYFAAVAPTRPGVTGRTLARIADVMDSPRDLEQLPESYRNLLGDTLAITRLQAGSSTNAVPTTASADLDIRLLPGRDPEAKLRELRALLPPDIEIEVLLSGPPSPPAPADTKLYRVLEREMLAAEPGSRVGPMAFPGTTDSRFFRARGIVAYGVSPFKINYYDAGGVHGVDERIRLAFFLQGVDVMTRVVRRFCLADPE